jgi:hypothetical protein
MDGRETQRWGEKAVGEGLALLFALEAGEGRLPAASSDMVGGVR